MYVKMYFVLPVLYFLDVFCADKITFLQEYLSKIDDPGILVAHLCWNRDNYIKLQRKLNKANIRYIFESTNVTRPEQDLYHTMFLADMECGFFNSFMDEAYRKELLRYPNKWIIFGKLADLKETNFYFPINSYAIVVEETYKGTLTIQALYKLNKDSDYLENTIGNWSLDASFQNFNELTLIKNRTNFYGMPLRVSYVILDNSSLVQIEDNRNIHADKLTKINYLMFEHFVDIWNMTHAKVLRGDWGLEFHPTKHYYRGMLGDLNYGRADVGGTVSFTPPERFKYFKYLLNTVKGLSLHFVFRAPPLAYSTNLYALTFDSDVWIGCGVILTLCCLVIWVIMTWESRVEIFNDDRAIYEENSANFLDIVMMQIAVVSQMDYYHEPRSTGGKIATFTLLLAFSYIYNAFSARIVILLQSSANNLHTVTDLYDAKMEMGAEDIPYNTYYFSRPAKRTNEKLRALIYDSKIAPKGKNPNFFTAGEGMRLVQTSYFAFHVETTTANNIIAESFTDEEKCSVRMVETIFKDDIAHLSCPRNSTYVKYFLIGFHRLFETGVHSRENRRKFTKLPKCTVQSSIFVSVGLREAYFPFGIFIIGNFLSLLLFIVEVISDTYLKHKKKGTLKICVRPFA